MLKRSWLGLLASGLCLVAGVASATTYSYQKISIPGAPGGTTPTGLNASGTVIGSWMDSKFVSHGFMYKGGKITKFDPPGSLHTYPTSINTGGAIIGTFVTGVATKAFTYFGGKFVEIALPNKSDTLIQVAGLNSKGVWLGSAADGHAEFIFTDTSGKFTNVVVEHDPTAAGLNDAGSVTGYYRDTDQSFVVIAGKLSAISIAGAVSTTPYGINNSNEVVGEDDTSAGGQESFLYQNGKATAFNPPGWGDSTARGINNSGLIIGDVQNSKGQIAVYADDKNKFTILTIPGVMTEAAVAVNDAGQILISATSASGEAEAYLATPKS